MATNNVFGKLTLDRKGMIPAVAGLGGADIAYQRTGSNMQLSCNFEGRPFKMAVYENKDGTTTLSALAGQDRAVFETTALAIKTACSFGEAGRFEVSLSKVPQEHAQQLVDYLKTEGTVEREADENSYSILKIRGQQGDILTIKRFKNLTVQLQGRHAMMASRAHDFLTTILPYQIAVQLQIDTFAVPIKAEQVMDELQGILPFSHDKLGTTVRAQFASALTLTKVNVALPDYGAIVFPAVRGLEGFIHEGLYGLGFQVPKRDAFHEYFEQGNTAKSFVMRKEAAETAGEPRATRLAECYTFYYNQRHGIAHMEADPEMSRVISTAEEAKGIVREVFDFVEKYHQ
jgi:hypothetical protein